MPSISRRRLLHGSAALLTGLAGCSDSTTERGSVPPEDPANVARDPEALVVRTAEERATVAWLPEDESAGSNGNGDGSAAGSTASATPPEDARHRRVVASRRTADRLRFAEADRVRPGDETSFGGEATSPAASETATPAASETAAPTANEAATGSASDTAAAAAREFVAGTDFDAETLYLEHHDVRECFVLELCYVTWSATEVDTQYGSYYRDADVSCRAEERDTALWLVRIPDALDPDEVSGHGSGWSSNGCRTPPHLRTTREGGSATAANRSDSTADRPATTADQSATSANRSDPTGDRSATEGDR